MKYVKLALALAFFVPAFAILGAESRGGHWPGWIVGGFIGLVFGGNPKWKFWNSIFGPEDEEANKPSGSPS